MNRDKIPVHGEAGIWLGRQSLKNRLHSKSPEGEEQGGCHRGLNLSGEVVREGFLEEVTCKLSPAGVGG